MSENSLPSAALGNKEVSVPGRDREGRNAGLETFLASNRNGKSVINRVAIVGLGYVGLPLALQFARSGSHVLGIDIDPAKVDELKAGSSYLSHVEAGDLPELLKSGHFDATTDFSTVSGYTGVILCVPTPLNKYREPDLSYVLKTAEALAPHLSRGMVVVLESTTYPGTTDEELRAVLEEGSGLKAGRDFHLAFSPEREDPGNAASRVQSIPKVIGGYTPACLEKATALYAPAVDKLVPVSSCRAAEATKLLENIFRSVNIALVNELKVIYAEMGIDIWEVIEAAKTKPFGYMPFYPGPGLGGHCIPIDPFYLTWKAREFGQNTRFIELAGEINTAMPRYVVSRVSEALNAHAKPLRGSRVLLVGLAYKPNVADDRESPSYVLLDLLTAQGAEVEYYDPYIPEIHKSREHAHWNGKRSLEWNREALSGFDVAIIATNHGNVDHKELSTWVPCIIDTRNTLPADCAAEIWRA